MPEISKTTDQALALLLAIAERQPVSAIELCRALEMNRTVAQRLLATLHGRGFVRRDGDEYHIGATLLWVARTSAPSLRQAARPIMEELAGKTGETVVLQVIDGDDVVILDQVIATRHVVRVEQNLISRHSMYLGASGRVLLAYQPERTVRRVLAANEGGPTTFATLERIREAGFDVSQDELQWGVHCVAAPIHGPDGSVPGVLATLVPVDRATRKDELVAAMRAAALAASTVLRDNTAAPTLAELDMAPSRL